MQALRQLRLRQGLSLPLGATIGKQAHELLGIERVAARPLEHGSLELLAEDGSSDEVGDELGRLPIRKWRKVDRGRVSHPARPTGMLLVKLWPGRAENEQRHALRPLRQMLEEGEKRL